MSLAVGYVGTRALRLPVFLDANLVGQTPHGMPTYNVQDASNNITSQITVPVYLQSDRRNSASPRFNTGFSVANTWYNSLAVTVRRPFSNGLEMLANYTWARATDTGQVAGNYGTFYGGDTPLDPNNSAAKTARPTPTSATASLSASSTSRSSSGQQDRQACLRRLPLLRYLIASGGQPISLAMSGTVYSGTGTSYGADGNIYGGA